MPTYGYRCEACNHEFEEFQLITAKPLKKCPACGKKSLNRLIGTGGAILFKGSGFYITDYRSDSYQKAAKSDSKDTSKSSSESKSTTEKAAPAATEKPASKPAEKSKN